MKKTELNKCKLIILGTGEVTLAFTKICLNTDRLEVLGVIVDSSVSEEVNKSFLNKLEDYGVVSLEMDEGILSEADIIFMPEYRRIIPKEYVEKYCFINCHGGILPKYRGYAANAWAIMNGEESIGYTIHQANGSLDDGKIYFVKKIDILPEQTYADVHDKMIQSIISEVPQLLVDIFDKKCLPYEQDGERVYCNKFSPSMGNIENYNVTSNYIFNLYRCMAKPLGTGIHFFYKGCRYNVSKVELGTKKNICNYLGIAGKVVNIEDNEIWVKTQDNVIVYSNIEDQQGNSVDVRNIFKNGCMIGK